ncbi:MAG: DUF1638 domain-containing protein [Peptostreptococcaceae bacterium]
MKDIIIACENLKDEITYIAKELNLELDIVYLESQLHNTPILLNEKLQNEIDKYQSKDNIILLFGLCGNGLAGLKSKNSKLICPKVDDCISLYMGGVDKRMKLKDATATYFFTKRYIENEFSIYNEMKSMKLKYGEEKTNKIYKSLFKKYKYIRTINTGAYDENDIKEKIYELCEVFDLIYESVDGDLNLLYKALNKEFDDNFIILEKENELRSEYFNSI